MHQYDVNTLLRLPSCLITTSYTCASVITDCRRHHYYNNTGSSEKSKTQQFEVVFYFSVDFYIGKKYKTCPWQCI